MYVPTNQKAVSLNVRFATPWDDLFIHPVEACGYYLILYSPAFCVGPVPVAGRCALTPPDPQLKGAWYPGGFNPAPIK